MAQIDDLNNNIEQITLAINAINESVNIAPMPSMNIREHFLTDRQVIKKVIMAGGNTTGEIDPTATDIQMNETDAHSLVYGKLMYDDNGNLVDDEVTYPECVSEKTKLKDSHPMKMWVKNKKVEVASSFDQLKSKSVEIGEASTQLGIETTASFITIGSSAAILPFGSGLPVAFSALQGIFSALQAFQTKVVQILPILEPLTFVAILIPLDMIGTVIGLINGLLSVINGALSAVAALLTPISQLKSLLGSSPDTPNLQMDEISVAPSTVEYGNNVKLSVTASNGSWQYTYLWTDEYDGFISNKREVVLGPQSSRTYTCTVTDEQGGAIVTGQASVIVT